MRKLKTSGWPVIALVLVVGSLLVPSSATAKTPRKRHLLFFTLSSGYRHASIPTAEQVITEIGEKSGAFNTTVSQDVSVFNKANLKHYDAIMFYTTGELPMTDAEKGAFLDFVRSGHGFVGVHSATDTFYMWEPYLELIGGYFNDHPWHQKVTIDVVDPSRFTTRFIRSAIFNTKPRACCFGLTRPR